MKQQLLHFFFFFSSPASAVGTTDLRHLSLSLGPEGNQFLLSLIECRRFDLTLGFQLLDSLIVFPAHLGCQISQSNILVSVLQAEHLECIRDNNTLHLIIGSRDTFKDLEALQGSGTASGFVRDHAAEGAPEDARGGTELDSAATGVGDGAFAHETFEFGFLSNQATGDDDFFAADNNLR